MVCFWPGSREQAGKPNRRVYSITDAGRTALSQMFQRPARADTFRSEFLFLAMFAQYLPIRHHSQRH